MEIFVELDSDANGIPEFVNKKFVLYGNVPDGILDMIRNQTVLSRHFKWIDFDCLMKIVD